MYPNVMVIIVNWNAKGKTAECLNCVTKLDYPNFEVVVIDNASTDDSVNYLKEYFPKINYIENKKNVGWTGGVNSGIEYSMKRDIEYMFILNNDIILQEDCLKKLVEIAEIDPNIGFVGPRIRSLERPEKILSPGINRNYKTMLLKMGEARDNGQLNEIKDVNWVDDTALLVRGDVIRNVGMHDPLYFMYGEDADWSYRVNKAGFRILYAPCVSVLHKSHMSSGGKYNSFIAYYQARNYFIYMNKYFSRYYLLFSVPFFFFRIFLVRSLWGMYQGKWDIPIALIKGALWHAGFKK